MVPTFQEFKDTGAEDLSYEQMCRHTGSTRGYALGLIQNPHPKCHEVFLIPLIFEVGGNIDSYFDS